MIRIIHVVRELGRNLCRNPGTALASLLSLTLLFLLFDIFWVAAGTSHRFYRDLLSELRVEVFLNEEVPDSIATNLADRFTGIEGVLEAEYVSREQARQRLADLVGSDLLIGYEEDNPLPRSFVLTVDDDCLNSTQLDRIESEIRAGGGVADVYYSRGWLEKAEETRSVILQIGLALGILILATALVSSANNIRLMTRARAVGFRQMFLQGAGRFFVAFPFLIESFLLGGLSALLGWLIIWYGRTRVQFSQLEIVFPTRDEIALFCLITALLGAISGLLGLRRMLRE